MKDHPILFSKPMVHAILAGKKTQTRRAIKSPFDNCHVEIDGGLPVLVNNEDAEARIDMQCPYGWRKDRLWVRESFRLCAEADHIRPRDTDAAFRIWYEADAPHQPGTGKLRPGMFMPRWASRITLEVIGVRVERLQDISADDAKAEGIVAAYGGYALPDGSHFHAADRRVSYWSLWDAINGAGSVEANPWVWVVKFRRLP